MSNYRNGNSRGTNIVDAQRLSKFEVLKNKKKSLIPLPRCANANSNGSNSQCPQHLIHSHPAEKSSSYDILRPLKSVHFPPIPTFPTNANNENIDTTNPSVEGPISALSIKGSSQDSKQVLLESDDDNGTITIFHIHEDETNTPNQSEPLSSFMSTSDHLLQKGATRHVLVALANKYCETACRIIRYFLCPICNEPFSRPAIIACGHLHCMRCVSNWFEDQDSCPCCRYRIIIKDVNNNSLLAKDFYETNFLLASVFAAGNFNISSQDLGKILCNNHDLANPLAGDISDLFRQGMMTNFIAATFRQIFQQERVLHGDISKWADPTIREGNCFMAAIWFLRQVMWIVESHSSDVHNIKIYKRLLNLEALHGNDRSRESFVKQVMTVKRPVCKGESSNFTVPDACLSNSRKKSLVADTGYSLPRLRFRLPSTQGAGKILLTSCIFVIIAFAVHICDSQSNPLFSHEKDNVNFYKLDFFVYAVSLFTMAAYTESERMAFWRRRRRNNRERRDHRILR